MTIDDGEIHESIWARRRGPLARRDAGEVELAPPTWVTLDRLARSATVAEALDEARHAPVEAFVTAIGKDGDDLVALWHGDAGYESGDATVARPPPPPRHVQPTPGSTTQLLNHSSGDAGRAGHPRVSLAGAP